MYRGYHKFGAPHWTETQVREYPSRCSALSIPPCTNAVLPTCLMLSNLQGYLTYKNPHPPRTLP